MKTLGLGSETEEAGATLVPLRQEPKDAPHSFLQDYEIPLTSEEARSAAGFRFLVAEVRRKDIEIRDLEQFRKMYYESDKECAVLRVSGKPSKIIDAISSILMSAGSLLLGLSIKSEPPSKFSVAIGAIGALLALSGMGTVVVRASMGLKT